MKKFGLSFMAAAGMMVFAACGESEEGNNEGNTSEASGEASQSEEAADNETSKDEVIEIGVTPWTSTVPPTEIATIILEDMGYEVEQTQADVGGVFTGLSTGELDVFMDGWFPMHNTYMEEYGDSLDETAVSYPEAEVGWVVPTYMEDINSLEDLKGNEGQFENEMYAIEEGAEATETSRNMVENYNLDMEVVASSEGGMMAQASRKIQQEEPVVFYGWRPHPMFNNYDLKVLKDPDNFFETSKVKVITNADFKDKAPEAYEFLSNWSIDIGEVEQMIVDIEENNEDPKDVAQEWIDNHQDKVESMKGE
ncbi:glycine betaine ABC transporter substrate-binding protein [Salibacterium halotolerans]|uniref:Glycine betaine/proline transport system substrate-binding protein n=1 Tax=Salibacterium halotolerans TaxID=1884432 RepID=A0A1I5X106_9BACI|nr:glycine betaine ABC transporter substrate-binding protein [Salibacterium halotolerans]SFQ25618.1 glycine betaine/proline transport system substrate-binding protein [Salibacterium halotolerans]